jgi:hypothetical protein
MRSDDDYEQYYKNLETVNQTPFQGSITAEENHERYQWGQLPNEIGITSLAIISAS